GTAGYHPHESPVSMLIPLGVLSIGAIFAGLVFAPPFLQSEEFWGGAIYYNEALLHAMHGVPVWVKLAATVVMLIGVTTAWFAYIKDTSIPGKFVAQFRMLHAFLYNKWYFDELYNFLFVKPAFWLGRQLWMRGDVGLIDRFGPNGAAWVVARGTLAAKRVQSGYLYSYALVMLVGLVAAITWVML
ncbi:MAG: NADH-quinone oxidoreductase subunit L, partial [Betaproteobacteria bacterium]|nr:NADH-quinone oxidoreductase subunit L [Betaproteobacteria bacterium]